MQSERTFQASRTKALLLLCTSLVFVGLGWLMTSEALLIALIGWACIVFFSLGVPAALIMVMPGVIHLRLDSEGVELKSIGNRKKIKWQDVKSFRIASISGTKMIAIEYQPDYAHSQTARAVASSISGIEGAIPNNYTVSLAKLEEELNEWLSRYGRPGT